VRTTCSDRRVNALDRWKQRLPMGLRYRIHSVLEGVPTTREGLVSVTIPSLYWHAPHGEPTRRNNTWPAI
jgi:hypothetical protein